MNKKNKILSIITLFIVSFLLIGKVEAATLRSTGYPNNPFNNSGITYNNTSQGYGISPHNRKFQSIQVFSVTDGGKTSHAYCVQPGVPLKTGATANGQTLSSWVTPTMAQNISYVLTYGYAIPEATSASRFDSSVKSLSNDNYYRIVATQALVWEIMTGERTSMSIHAPSVACMNNRNSCLSGGFFTTLFGSNDSRLVAVRNHYTSIIDAIRFTFGSAPARFSTAAAAPTGSMAWDGSKYTISYHDSNNAYKYYKVNSTTKGVKATISNDGSTLTITSTNPIDASAPAMVELKTTGNTGYGEGNTVYVSDDFQNVAKIGIASVSYYTKVYTPKYQLRVTKSATLDGKKLSGATFKICNNSSCTKVLSTITTNSSGVATYNEIPSPGTYFLQETKAPAGYELNATPIAVTVSSGNIAGSNSYGSVNATNTNKEFNLTKTTVDENGKTAILNDGCGTETYTGPEFEIKDSKGTPLYFIEKSAGFYDLATKDTKNAVSKIKTCNGKFKVYTLPDCNYTISETKAPDGLTLPANASKSVNVCGSGKNVSFTNGYTGLEFQKKDEDGNLVSGGKFALQRKINNVYKDILIKENSEGSYTYVADLKETDEGATYILLTDAGISRISKLPPGEYRIVEKEAPEGYEAIEDKDSTAIVTIKDSQKEDYYLVEMIDQKVTKNGSRSSAELIVTIITGRFAPNYVLIISGLAVLLVAALIVRKKLKK